MTVALSLAAGSVPAAAQQESRELDEGTWLGTAWFDGTVESDVAGVTGEFTGGFYAQFDFDVALGVTTGEWEASGDSLLTVESSDGTLVADLSWEGAGSFIGGLVEIFTEGTQRTTGSATVTAEGGEFTAPVDNTTDSPPIRVVVQRVICNEAQGDWIQSLEDLAEQAGWVPELVGSFYAVRQGIAMSDSDQESIFGQMLRLQEMNDAFTEDVLAMRADPVAGRLEDEPTFRDDYMRRVGEDLTGLLAYSEEVFNELRNLSDCDRALLEQEDPETRARFMTFPVAVIQQLIILVTAEGENVLPHYLTLMTSAGLRTGAIGPGAITTPDGPPPDQVEELLRREAEDFLQSQVDELQDLDQACRAIVLGAQMGWSFTIDGETRTASSMAAQFGGSCS